jgi:hypothetical protein
MINNQFMKQCFSVIFISAAVLETSLTPSTSRHEELGYSKYLHIYL